MQLTRPSDHRSDLLKQTELFVLISICLSIYAGSLKGKIDGIKDCDSKVVQEIKDQCCPICPECPGPGIKPPMFVLQDSCGGNFFEVGSASIYSCGINDYLTNTLRDTLYSLVTKHKKQGYNTLLVVGHTDEQRLSNANSQFEDQVIEEFYKANENFNIACNSNIDLGLLRALAVMKRIKEFGDFGGFIDNWVAYSGGPFYDDNGLVNKISREDIPERRRVEIRLINSPEIISVGF